MPQLAMRQQIAMGQFALTRQLLMSGPQQKQQQNPQQPQEQKHQQPAPKATKVTKVRRARQSRNPQLSVARRNERERNRVKMVNNGFALLRDHLPVEYLQQTGGYESAGSETPDLGALGAKSPGSQSSKAKKFSKVETLRAAIQHIKMLQELMRSADPNFESIDIPQEVQARRDELEPNSLGYDDIDSGPLSCGDGPLSCGSSSSLASSSLAAHQSQHSHPTAPVYARDQLAASNPEQFVKLEPFAASGHVQFQPQIVQPASPLDSAATTIQTSPVGQQQQHLSLYSQAPTITTQVHQQQTIASSETATSEHTHLWIQQHQSSFMEQQQQQQYLNQDQWSPYQQQQQFVQHHQELSPSTLAGGNIHYQQQQQQQQMQFASQQQLDSPLAGHWFAPSPPNSTIQQQVAGESVNFAGHHQISLYSQ